MKYQIMVMIHSTNIDRTNVTFNDKDGWMLFDYDINARRPVKVFFYKKKLIIADSIKDIYDGKCKEYIIDSHILYDGGDASRMKCLRRVYATLTNSWQLVMYDTRGHEWRRLENDRWTYNEFPVDPIFQYVGRDAWIVYDYKRDNFEILDYNHLDTPNFMVPSSLSPEDGQFVMDQALI